MVKLMGTGYAKRIIDEHKSNPFLKHFQEINPSSWSVSFRPSKEVADGQGVARREKSSARLYRQAGYLEFGDSLCGALAGIEGQYDIWRPQFPPS
jgi:hypothetical protein